MGTLTFTELQDEVRSALGGRTDLNARLPRALNLAQQRLARIHDFEELQNVTIVNINDTGVAADGIIALPSNREVYSIILLDDANSRKLTQRTARFWDARLPMPEYWTRDKPQDYLMWAGSAEIWPLPDGPYTLRIRRTVWPTTLSGANDLSVFNEKDEILIELSLMYLFNSLGKEVEADKHKNAAAALITEAKGADSTKPDLDISLSSGTASSTTPYLDPFVKATGE